MDNEQKARGSFFVQVGTGSSRFSFLFFFICSSFYVRTNACLLVPLPPKKKWMKKSRRLLLGLTEHLTSISTSRGWRCSAGLHHRLENRSKVPDQVYLSSPSSLDEMLNSVNLSLFNVQAFFDNLSIHTPWPFAYDVTQTDTRLFIFLFLFLWGFAMVVEYSDCNSAEG